MLEFNLNLFLYQLVTFVAFAILVAAIYKRFLAPVLAERRERIDGDMARAAEARNQAEGLKMKYEARMAAVGDETAAIIKRVNDEAARHREELLTQARQQADALRRQAEKLIAFEEARAANQLRGELADYAVAIAGRVLEETRTPERERELARRFVAELESKGAFARRPAA
jgi:F-type H+-transporting ATPase subunit b